MYSIKTIAIVFLALILSSCSEVETSNEKENQNNEKVKELSASQKIIAATIEAHGGELYRKANYAFVFRGNTYQFKNDGNNYEYARIAVKGDSTIHDILINGDLTRTINGQLTELTEKEVSEISEGINSVIYFATLPYKLSDNSVNSKYIETIFIKEKEYDVIEVTFDQEGGGKDFDDEYYYWINKDSKKIDYLAYNYAVNGGGVRFRSAYNVRVVDGITFQDYVNYKAEVGTPLKDLPALFEADSLVEVSRIDTEKVVNLNNI